MRNTRIACAILQTTGDMRSLRAAIVYRRASQAVYVCPQCTAGASNKKNRGCAVRRQKKCGCH